MVQCSLLNWLFFFSLSVIDIKCHCMMGLFSEIGRAWLTIDSDIYVSSQFPCVKPKVKNDIFSSSDLEL